MHSWVAIEIATYSASVLERDIICYFLLHQKMAAEPKKTIARCRMLSNNITSLIGNCEIRQRKWYFGFIEYTIL